MGMAQSRNNPTLVQDVLKRPREMKALLGVAMEIMLHPWSHRHRLMESRPWKRHVKLTHALVTSNRRLW